LKLKKLSIKNLRNIQEVTLDCDSGIHFIHGQNAQGKTSILESIYLLSNLRSFRDSDVAALLQHGQNFAQVKGEFQIDSNTQAELKVDLIQGPSRFEKRAYINQKLSKSAVDYFGVKLQHSPIQFHAINLNPTSTDLIRGEPGLRRNYLNQVISSENPEYMHVLKRYQKILDQKNALLKLEEKLDLQLLKILNENLVIEGAWIMHTRLEYLQKLAQPILDFLSNIAPLQRGVNLGYLSKVFMGIYPSETLYFTGQFDLPSVEILMENLHQKLAQSGAQERARRTSVVGPHRDDVVFRVGIPSLAPLPDLLDVGSQGEIRSLLLALKLSELENFKKHTQVQPVLLIDDFSSELDSTRRGFLLNYLKDSELQIFVTSTDLFTEGKTINMVHGKIV
jgi:DNA replication and repair protein RecF